MNIKIAQRNGTLIHTFLPERAIDFIVNQPMVILSGQDVHEDIWASILASEPGFVTARDAQHLCIDLRKSILHASDPIWQILNNPCGIGLRLIELETRRRLRVNGHADYDKVCCGLRLNKRIQTVRNIFSGVPSITLPQDRNGTIQMNREYISPQT